MEGRKLSQLSVEALYASTALPSIHHQNMAVSAFPTLNEDLFSTTSSWLGPEASCSVASSLGENRPLGLVTCGRWIVTCDAQFLHALKRSRWQWSSIVRHVYLVLGLKSIYLILIKAKYLTESLFTVSWLVRWLPRVLSGYPLVLRNRWVRRRKAWERLGKILSLQFWFVDLRAVGVTPPIKLICMSFQSTWA